MPGNIFTVSAEYNKSSFLSVLVFLTLTGQNQTDLEPVGRYPKSLYFSGTVNTCKG